MINLNTNVNGDKVKLSSFFDFFKYKILGLKNILALVDLAKQSHMGRVWKSAKDNSTSRPNAERGCNGPRPLAPCSPMGASRVWRLPVLPPPGVKYLLVSLPQYS